jgi:hypothetical protein
MPPLRKIAFTAAAFGLLAGASTVANAQPTPKVDAPRCAETSVATLTAPIGSWKGAPLRVIFAAEEALDGDLTLTGPDGAVAATTTERHGGPPYFWLAEVESPAPGAWQATLRRPGASAECATVSRQITVAKTQPPSPRGSDSSVWPLRASWNRETENLYSAWIEKLFDAPLADAPSWKALHDVLRDKSRNVLFNYLGLREDEQKLVIRPDCADLPYFLRAYFAFKMGLPFGYSKCSRGGGGGAPRCTQWWNIKKEEPPPGPPEQKVASGGFFFDQPMAAPSRGPQRPKGLVPGFGFYTRNTIANGVHSGNGRTALEDDSTDYYPVALKQETLRPGTIYADPYGHVLVIAKRVPQTADAAGLFLAVDGQPDGTVARKRFWRGNFLFAQDPALGGPGFKRFRPIVADKSGGLRRLANAEIAKSPDYGDFSLEQGKLSIEDFYDRMDDVMSPAPLDPQRALLEVISALEEQVKTRVTSVENGRKYQTGGGAEVAMPDGPSIFETTGAWEDFATPSRDLRLLIAIDVVRGFPDRVARLPQRYAMPQGKSVEEVKAGLEQTLASEIAARKFEYTRTDGTPWTLTLKDVIDRMGDLEMAYNVNDCVELRWGASDKSEESATCKRRASSSQRTKMAQYRDWFHERKRPARD